MNTRNTGPRLLAIFGVLGASPPVLCASWAVLGAFSTVQGKSHLFSGRKCYCDFSVSSSNETPLPFGVGNPPPLLPGLLAGFRGSFEGSVSPQMAHRGLPCAHMVSNILLDNARPRNNQHHRASNRPQEGHNTIPSGLGLSPGHPPKTATTFKHLSHSHDIFFRRSSADARFRPPNGPTMALQSRTRGP